MFAQVREAPPRGSLAVIWLWPLGPTGPKMLAQVRVVWSMPRDENGFGGFGGTWVRIEADDVGTFRVLSGHNGGPFPGKIRVFSPPGAGKRYVLQFPDDGSGVAELLPENSVSPNHDYDDAVRISATVRWDGRPNAAHVVRLSEASFVVELPARIPDGFPRILVRSAFPTNRGNRFIELRGEIIERVVTRAGMTRAWARLLSVDEGDSPGLYSAFLSKRPALDERLPTAELPHLVPAPEADATRDRDPVASEPSDPLGDATNTLPSLPLHDEEVPLAEVVAIEELDVADYWDPPADGDAFAEEWVVEEEAELAEEWDGDELAAADGSSS
jgi:hypothetical protein